MTRSYEREHGAALTRRGVARHARGLAAVGGALVLVAVPACRGSSTGAPERSSEPAGSSTEPGPPEGAAAPQAEFHEATFDLSIRGAGSYSAGKKGEVEIVLLPRGGYHPNDKYPYKLKLKSVPGLVFPSPVVTKEAVTLEPARATMKVELVPESSGDREVAGQFAFSLCSADRCLVEKRELATKIHVD